MRSLNPCGPKALSRRCSVSVSSGVARIAGLQRASLLSLLAKEVLYIALGEPRSDGRTKVETLLEFPVQRLRPADEADGGHAVAPLVEGVLGGLDDLGVVGHAEVVVRAEVEDVAAAVVRDSDVGLLGRGEDALRLVKALVAKLGELGGEVGPGTPTVGVEGGMKCLPRLRLAIS